MGLMFVELRVFGFCWMAWFPTHQERGVNWKLPSNTANNDQEGEGSHFAF